MTAAATRRSGRVPAAVDPVARLMVDVPLPHLDRPFDYPVPDTLDEQVQAGSRVRVRFAGRLVDGFVLERRADSEHEGRLAFIERSVGGEPVLTDETAALFRAVADRWAGNFVDVVRLGVPARHAAAERTAREPADGDLPAAAESGLHRVRRGRRVPVRGAGREAGPGRVGGRAGGETGRRASPRRRAPRWPPGGAPSSSCPTPATSTASTPR